MGCFGGGGGGTTTTIQSADPWVGAQDYLRTGLQDYFRLYKQQMWGEDGAQKATPYPGERVAGFSDPQVMAQMMAMQKALNPSGAANA